MGFIQRVEVGLWGQFRDLALADEKKRKTLKPNQLYVVLMSWRDLPPEPNSMDIGQSNASIGVGSGVQLADP